MKILHINDLAGVAPVLVKYLRKAGHEADWISFIDDDFGHSGFYGGRHFHDQQLMKFFLRGLIPKYDIIHLHFSYPLLEWLYQFDKPIVMHYHGTEIAMNTVDCMTLDYKSKLVLVAGEQLLQYHPRAKCLPTIVDTEHFQKKGEPKDNALVFDIPYLELDKALEVFNKVDGGKIIIHNREQIPIPYSHLPEILNNYHKYVDVRYHKQRGLLTDLSKTALEALACGVKVLDYKGNWIEGLPERHKPENVVQQLIKMYEGIL